MLHLERRHVKACNEAQKKKGAAALSPKELKRCACPLRAVGTTRGGAFIRPSLDTSDLISANDRMRDLDEGRPLKIAPPTPKNDLPISDAFDKFKSILRTQRGVKESSLYYHYDQLQRSLVKFAKERKAETMSQISGEHGIQLLDDFVASWQVADNTRAHRIGTLMDFFNTAWTRKWIDESPTVHMVRPKLKMIKRTLPFDLHDEEPRIVAAIPHWTSGMKHTKSARNSCWSANPETASALLCVLRYTGLRISDAILFEPRDLVKRTVDGREVYCYFLPSMVKTSQPVFIPVDPEIAAAIISAPRLTERYAFYDPEGTENESLLEQRKHRNQWHTRVNQNLLLYLGIAAGVPNVHAHRFRDTFAVSLLNNGVDIRTVSRFLGHTDIATTLRYYEHYIPGDQDKAVRAMVSAWDKSEKVITFAPPKRRRSA